VVVVAILRSSEAVFWRLVYEGSSAESAAVVARLSVTHGRKRVRQAGGVIPQHVLRESSGRYLDQMDRAVIMVARRQGLSMREIGRLVGRSPSTISRELRRNRRFPRRYDARIAQVWADRRAPRPQPMKLALDPRLHEFVQTRLDMKWSPEQVSSALKTEFPAEERMRLSPETIYRSIYVQARGSLKRELEAKLRTGRTLRKPRRQAAADGRGQYRISDMVMISERPAEVADRAVPGHWEGDLIVGKDSGSQIGTLVERSTRYCLLVALPASREADVVAAALIETIKTLPAELVKSLTWDQGIEMAAHKKVTVATGVEIYFCDPHSPWQRGSNENTNGLLRQYFPKGTDLSLHTPEHLAFVARELNGRPRKTLEWKSPAQALDELLSRPAKEPGVATTT
jgi:IS30 family transposase